MVLGAGTSSNHGGASPYLNLFFTCFFRLQVFDIYSVQILRNNFIFKIQPHKEEFYIKDPSKTTSTNQHLPDHLATMCLEKLQRPVNPHRQRLLSAAARVAKVDNKPKEPEGATGPKKPKAKAKGEAKSKARAKSKAPAKAVPKVKGVQAQVQADAHAAYNNAKKAFMTGFLAGFQDNNQQNTLIYYVNLFFYGT